MQQLAQLKAVTVTPEQIATIVFTGVLLSTSGSAQYRVVC